MNNQNNDCQNRFWSLLSKKLATEANEDELRELHSILLAYPELHHQSDLISDMWAQKSKDTNYANEAAYMRHVMKYKEEFFTDEQNEVVADEVVTAAPEEKQSVRRRFSKR